MGTGFCVVVAAGDEDGALDLLRRHYAAAARIGTVTADARLLKERGARRIFAAVSHALLNEKALARLAGSPIEELICTDSVPMAKGEGVTTLGIADLLGEAICRIHGGESVTSLFKVS